MAQRWFRALNRPRNASRRRIATAALAAGVLATSCTGSPAVAPPAAVRPIPSTAVVPPLPRVPAIAASEPASVSPAPLPVPHIRLSPNAGPPGTLIGVDGWASPPASQAADPPSATDACPSGQVYELALQGGNLHGVVPVGWACQAAGGNLHGTFRAPLAVPVDGFLTAGQYKITLQPAPAGVAPSSDLWRFQESVAVTGPRTGAPALATAPFTLALAPTWASLGSVRPVNIQSSFSEQTIATDPLHPGRLAYCAPGHIEISADQGASWTQVPTPKAAGSYSLAPACAQVTLDPQHPRSFFAVFPANPKSAGRAGGNSYLGFATADAGAHWTTAPAADGARDVFGGFQATASGVEALYGEHALAAQQASNGGQTWRPSTFACGAAGPCLRWGPVPPSITSCSLHPVSLALERSVDGGRAWASPDWPASVDACFAQQLIALSGKVSVIVSPGADGYPLLLSHDAGKTWQPVALPALPDHEGAWPLYPGLQMLSNGTLLAEKRAIGDDRWQMLLPGAASWCNAALPAEAGARFQTIGQELWWMLMTTDLHGPSLRSVPLSSLTCATPAA